MQDIVSTDDKAKDYLRETQNRDYGPAGILCVRRI